MRKIDQLLNLANERDMGPAKSRQNFDGSQCHTWLPGAKDGSFVRVEDMPGDDGLLLTLVYNQSFIAAHDRMERAHSCIRTSYEDVLNGVEYVLGCMNSGVRINVDVL